MLGKDKAIYTAHGVGGWEGVVTRRVLRVSVTRGYDYFDRKPSFYSGTMYISC
jgi:hypothetical protein